MSTGSKNSWKVCENRRTTAALCHALTGFLVLSAMFLQTRGAARNIRALSAHRHNTANVGTPFLADHIRRHMATDYLHGCVRHHCKLWDECQRLFPAERPPCAGVWEPPKTAPNSVSPKCPHCGKGIIIAVTSGE